ncbi:TetR/AcrR family transcriptional regulator [Actinomycetospora chiangmaiensis]|uniref:TetR/AcrR family transcriptional regulator n=1 Tax=Actinomycetospora chiangmaiensis TaxID=402650 RepID=UPI00036B87F9|nr:TetR/AcrR family transcriptional regulator [Actinomycetospora chiangmaiensis]
MTDTAPVGTAGGEETASRGGRPRDPALDESIIEATRRRLVLDGYSAMSLGEIASDAGVSRPTIYRRWANKLDLTIDALDWGFRRQQASYPTAPLATMPPRAALTEAVRRVDPCYFNPDAMVLMGNFMGETLRTPELLAHVKSHAVEPRVRLVENTLAELQDRGAVRADVDRHTVATLCFGAYYAAFLRDEHDRGRLAEDVVATLWPALAV